MMKPAALTDRALVTSIKDASRCGDISYRNEAFERLVSRWLPFIRSRATLMSKSEHADYEQVGLLALFRATLTFDLGSPYSFRAYANRAVVFSMRSELRRRRSISATCVEFRDPLETPQPTIERDWTEECLPILQEWLETRSERDQRILGWIYWKGWSQVAVAAELGLSCARVSQILAESLNDARRFIAFRN